MDFLRETEGAPFFRPANSALAPLLFDFNGHSIRVVTLKDQPWFIAADVCRALNYTRKSDGQVNTFNALRPLEPSQITTARISDKRGAPPKLITEAGVYTLVMRSDKPEAKAFQKWVAVYQLDTARNLLTQV